jgi:hypothetical protein
MLIVVMIAMFGFVCFADAMHKKEMERLWKHSFIEKESVEGDALKPGANQNKDIVMQDVEQDTKGNEQPTFLHKKKKRKMN